MVNRLMLPDFVWSSELPTPYQKLAWHTFFEQRGRGLSFYSHFPWAKEVSLGTWSATLWQGQELVAGLVVRDLSGGFEFQNPGLRTAVIGLVCVAEPHRGKGISSFLLDTTLEHLQALRFDSVTLWTNKPAVYANHGFTTEDRSLFGIVRREQCALTEDVLPFSATVKSWPDGAEFSSQLRGLPPFSNHAWRLEAADGSASAVVLLDSIGLALAEWSGQPVRVAELLLQTMPANWRINALRGDSLLNTLKTVGFTLELEQQHLQMWANLSGRTQEGRPDFRVLDRI